jgi:putative transposase
LDSERSSELSQQQLNHSPGDPAERKVEHDFVAARLLDGRWFRVLTVVGQFTRECLLLADNPLTGQKVALALSQVIAARSAPVSITVDNVLRD